MIGRAGKPPLRFRGHEEPGVEGAEILLPQQLALQVVGVQAFRPEERHQVPAIGRQRRTGVGGLRMALDDGNAGFRRALPAERAGLLVEAHHHPAMGRGVADRLDVAVEPDLQLRVRRAADGRGGAHLIAPHHRAGMSETGDRHAPAHELRPRHAPLQGRRRLVVHPSRLDAAEPRPVHAGARPGWRLRRKTDGDRQARTRGEEGCAHRPHPNLTYISADGSQRSGP